MHGVHHTVDLGLFVEKVGGDPQGKSQLLITHIEIELRMPNNTPSLFLQSVHKSLDLSLIMRIREGIKQCADVSMWISSAVLGLEMTLWTLPDFAIQVGQACGKQMSDFLSDGRVE